MLGGGVEKTARKAENGMMSKPTIFHNQNTLEDLFLIVFVFVDDYLKALEQVGLGELPTADNQKGSYSEIMTIALVGELMKQRYQGDWYDFVKIEYQDLFPELPHRTRFYRIQHKLEVIYADFGLRFAPRESLEEATYVIDSKPIPICKGKRYKRPRAMTEACSGYSSMGMFYGFKLHAIVTEQGLFADFLIAPANVSDQEAETALMQQRQAFVLGDKNYHGGKVYAQPKDNFKKPKPWISAFSWVRKTIETVFSSLVRSRNLALGQLNSFAAIRTSLCRKIAAHNLAWFLMH